MFSLKKNFLNSNKTEAKDPLFIRVLQWASDRGSVGFKMGELREATTKDEGEWVWVQRMMLGEIQGDPPLIFHLGAHHKEGEYTYFLTGSGAAALMDYLELKEARQSSKQARWYAIIAIVISVIVGAIQISRTQDVNVVNTPSVQPLEIKGGFIKTEVNNFPSSQNVKVNNDFLKTQIINWPK